MNDWLILTVFTSYAILLAWCFTHTYFESVTLERALGRRDDRHDALFHLYISVTGLLITPLSFFMAGLHHRAATYWITLGVFGLAAILLAVQPRRSITETLLRRQERERMKKAKSKLPGDYDPDKHVIVFNYMIERSVWLELLHFYGYVALFVAGAWLVVYLYR